MKKIIFLIFVITALCTSNVMASEVNDSTEIPEVKLEVLLQIMQSKKAKIDIIKKNNIEITKWKEELKSQIVVAAEKVNGLKLEVSNNSYQISEETLEELKSLLNFLQDSKKTLEEDVEKIRAKYPELDDRYVSFFAKNQLFLCSKYYDNAN